MINARLCCNKNGLLTGVVADGHAKFAQKGIDIVCAAVTILLRTTMAVLSKSKTVSIVFEAPKRGVFKLEVRSFAPHDEQKLVYAADFLVQGLQSLQIEFPDCVSVEVQTG